MKVILSRKGFDGQNGGIPSPILPDGRLLPLPIPSRRDQNTLVDLRYLGSDVSTIPADLSRGKHDLSTRIHLDPALERANGNHSPGWRPMLGQTGSAQGHLRSQGVGVGDVFLFFGWFREVESRANTWRYVPKAPNLHVLFGWIEVGAVVPISRERESALTKMPWIADHPHIAGRHYDADLHNTLYVAASRSKWLRALPSQGGGRFLQYDDSLRLTAPNTSKKSLWSLPGWFLPGDRMPLSYHSDRERWKRDGDRVLLQSVAKGQEFVLDMAHYPEAEHWIADLIKRHGGK
ncbi:MAG: hypothetical protein ACREPT_04960 [Rudaea sp.]